MRMFKRVINWLAQDYVFDDPQGCLGCFIKDKKPGQYFCSENCNDTFHWRTGAE